MNVKAAILRVVALPLIVLTAVAIGTRPNIRNQKVNDRPTLGSQNEFDQADNSTPIISSDSQYEKLILDARSILSRKHTKKGTLDAEEELEIKVMGDLQQELVRLVNKADLSEEEQKRQEEILSILKEFGSKALR